MMRELTKLTPQGHVHAQELYAAINLVRRVPPAPLLALLVTRPFVQHVGDLHFRLEDGCLMAVVKRFSLVKPTLQTPFHIDFRWWKQNERDWHVFLRSLPLPRASGSLFASRRRADDRLDRCPPRLK